MPQQHHLLRNNGQPKRRRKPTPYPFVRTETTGLLGLHDNDAKQVKVSSNADCSNGNVHEAGFPRGFGASVGMTSVVASESPLESDSVTLRPVGPGYVANKNKMVGAVRG